MNIQHSMQALLAAMRSLARPVSLHDLVELAGDILPASLQGAPDASASHRYDVLEQLLAYGVAKGYLVAIEGHRHAVVDGELHPFVRIDQTGPVCQCEKGPLGYFNTPSCYRVKVYVPAWEPSA